jgi:hypothetical protein
VKSLKVRPTRHVPSGDVACRERPEIRSAQSENVKSFSRSMVTPRNSPFRNYFRRRFHGSANFDRSTQIRLWRENTRKPRFERCTGANECRPGTSITAEIGEYVASTLSTRRISTPVAIRSEHAQRARRARLGDKRWTPGWSRGRCVIDAGNEVEYPVISHEWAMESSRNSYSFCRHDHCLNNQNLM